jgi:RNA polymerase sigma-70 factor (ECF subfamily)
MVSDTDGTGGWQVDSEPMPGPAPAASSVESLVTAIAGGDVDAFDALYGRVAGAVLGVALRVLRDPDLAQDVAQEALVEVWRQATRFDPSRGSAMAWLMTIAHRRAVDRVRREQTQSGLAARAAAMHEVPQSDEVPATVERTLDAARVRRALAGLSPVQREAIELAYWRGYTHQEVSIVLAVPLGTAKTRIRDGLIRLRDALTAEEELPS